jgi:anti-anti-sigma factor
MLEISQEQGATVLRVTASEIEMYTVPTLKTALLNQLQEKPAVIALDLESVEFIDSSGIGALLLLAKKAKEVGTNLFITGLRPEIRETMEVTGAIRLLQVRESLADVFLPLE